MMRTTALIAFWMWGLTTTVPSQTPGNVKPPTLAELESKIQTDSLDPEAHFRLAIRYWDLQRYDDVERELRTTRAIEPHYAAAYICLAYLPYARHPKLLMARFKGELTPEWRDTVIAALRLERQAFLLDPFVDIQIVEATTPDEEIWKVYGPSALPRIGTGGVIPNYLSWFDALRAIRAHYYGMAVSDVEYMLAKETRLEESDSVVRVPLRTSDYHYILAVLYQMWGKPADALEQYQTALTGDLGLYMAHVRLAHIYSEHHMWEKAIEELDVAIQEVPDDADLLLDLGLTHQAAGQLAAAEQALHLAIDHNPRDPRIPYALAVVEMLNNHTADARRDFTHFVAIAPSGMAADVTDARQRLAALPQ